MIDMNSGESYSKTKLAVTISFSGNRNVPDDKLKETHRLKCDEWHEVVFSIDSPEILKYNTIAVKPLPCIGIVSIAAIKITNKSKEKIYWNGLNKDVIRNSIMNDIFILSVEQKLKIMCLTEKGEIIFPEITDLPEENLEFSIWLKISTDLSDLEKVYLNERSKRKDLIGHIKGLDEALEKVVDQKKEMENISSEIEALYSLKKEIEDNKRVIKDLKDRGKKNKSLIDSYEHKLEYQKNLLHHYCKKLSESESKNIEVLTKIKRDNLDLNKFAISLENEIKKSKRVNDQVNSNYTDLRSILKVIEKDYKALIESKRWRVGKLIGNILDIVRFRRIDLAAITSINKSFETYRKIVAPHPVIFSTDAESCVRIVRLIEKFKDNFNEQISSWRWKSGDISVRIIMALLLQNSEPFAKDQILSIINSFDNWKEIRNWQSSDFKGSKEEAVQLKTWFEKIENNYNLLLVSKRWVIGNSIVNIIRRITFLPHPSIAVENINKILSSFHAITENKKR